MALTPMMQQYLQIKENYKDCILFFRLGDFYEMFFEDAEIVSRELELVLTGKSCGLEERAPMCGIPYHASNSYLIRLVNKGYKIAVCEQLEDASATKGIVKRDVVKVVTPGTYTDSSFLDEKKNNFIMSIYLKESKGALCFADLSTGEFYGTSIFNDEAVILDEISKFLPSEILIYEEIDKTLISSIKERFNTSFTSVKSENLLNTSSLKIKEQFKNYDENNFDEHLVISSNVLLSYINETQKSVLGHVDYFTYYQVEDFLGIDINSRRNLELTESLRDKRKKGSLLWVLDKTKTAMGARMLRKWVEQPLIVEGSINNRLNAIEELTMNMPLLDELRDELNKIYDIERLIGKISGKNVNAKELVSLQNSLLNLPYIKKLLSNTESDLLNNTYKEIDTLEDIHSFLFSSLLENPAISVKEGGIIKDGYNEEVDELRKAKAHGKEWIAALESREKDLTGIKSLKIRYNKVFGYYIEVTKLNMEFVPKDRYTRKQTLANAERYVTDELKEMEEKILGAEEKLTTLEYEIFVQIRDVIESHIDRMKKTSNFLSSLDCLCSLAMCAIENNYVKPIITKDNKISIKEGRHPVVEKVIQREGFISNDTIIDDKDNNLLLITGPNMAGKSTYMRQVALITVMAQIGSFVPAKEASISICDKVFTRIGASDDLAGGKSTFMVEMWEVANILKNSTKESLILLDEVGRGTSTYDGLSIAWAVIEFICENKSSKAKTLFATHYHELTSLEGKISGVQNYSIAVKKLKDDIVFLRKIIKGSADDSYGIEVAKLAGIPEQVTNRAKEILVILEKGGVNTSEVSYTIVDSINAKEEVSSIEVVKEKSKKNIKEVRQTEQMQLGFADLEKEKLIAEISNIDIINLTPMDSLNKLYDIIKKAKTII
ncbi:DNA mismatch repair protein MutS [Clostridium grantii]|uniref:DNA mismatch repair protein MutS n=1 Tax=Clostridium grantii DSM 8605 TaxID=1121316 RepID=A0A1M5VPF8_9CLOT|nr:DNA mismatch repair protein MutS [Clostridium grantii]SHH77115.1 DNA mismatch repair protein MutS [Clostridium grantii DSM 8605]